MLTTLLKVSEDVDASAEDIFDSAIDTIFPDETRNCHGYVNSQITYKSQPFGDVKLKLADPHGEDGRKLFAHYVWNASLLIAELIGGAEEGSARNGRDWKVGGERVIELGAG